MAGPGVGVGVVAGMVSGLSLKKGIQRSFLSTQGANVEVYSLQKPRITICEL